MAMEKAVVSTTIGAEGLPLTDGVELLLRDKPNAFAEAVIRVLTDQTYAGELGSCAAANVRQNHGWARVSERFASICASRSNQRDYAPVVEKSARAISN